MHRAVHYCEALSIFKTIKEVLVISVEVSQRILREPDVVQVI